MGGGGEPLGLTTNNKINPSIKLITNNGEYGGMGSRTLKSLPELELVWEGCRILEKVV